MPDAGCRKTVNLLLAGSNRAQRDKLTSLAEIIREAQEMSHKQEDKENVLESRPRPVKWNVVS